MREKVKGYLAFNDSKSVLEVFAQEEYGYEPSLEIDYGTERKIVDRILINASEYIELENLKDILHSDKYLIKFK